MNFWPRFISDITHATAHLTLEEMGAYDRLLDHFYETEKNLPGSIEACCRIVRANTKSERAAVSKILSEFFTEEDGCFVQHRASAELVIATKKIKAARENGKLGGRKKEPTGLPTGLANENPSGNPLGKLPRVRVKTIPSLRSGIETPPPAAAAPVVRPDGEVTERVWLDWLAVRKAKKHPMPTETALKGIRREFQKAGMSLQTGLEMCCAQSWSGFKASWLDKDTGETTYQKSMRERMEEFSPSIAAKRPGASEKRIDPMEVLDGIIAEQKRIA